MTAPLGFSTITPYFFVDQAEQFVDFLKSAFQGLEVGRSLRPDGKIANAQIKVGSSTIMMSEASEDFPAMRASYYLFVTDAHESMRRALAAGAKLEMPVGDMPYGDRQGGVVDPFGNIWWISQRLSSSPYFENESTKSASSNS